MPRWSSMEKVSIRLLAGEPAEDEYDPHITACNDYLRMGRGRGLKKLARHYKKMIELAKDKGLPAPDVPTIDGSGNRLAQWSSKFGWVERASLYDAMEEEKRNLARSHIMNAGFAQDHERVNVLNELTNRVLKELDKRGLYGIKKKGIGFGEDFQVINEEEFRRGEIREIRGLLDDLAKETGGRETNTNVKLSGLAGVLSSASNFDNPNIQDAEWEPIEDDDTREPSPSDRDP